MHGTDPDENLERRREVLEVLLKVGGVVTAIALVVWLGSMFLVRLLDLDSVVDTAGPSVQITPTKPLPTTALPEPTTSPTDGDPSAEDPDAEETPDDTEDPDAESDTGLTLSGTPVKVRPMERINLTGNWPDHDAVGLLVQRRENNQWSDFGVQAQVTVGTYSTYIQTGRLGEQRFRMYDPQSKTASNVVVITVG